MSYSVGSVAETVAAYIGHSETEVLAIADKAPRRYKRYLIPKKRGGTRAIHHPAKETKALQYALMETVLARLRIHDCAFAYRRGLKAPLRSNAAVHAKRAYSLKVDFRDFFHSITPADLFKALDPTGDQLTLADRGFLTRCLFVTVNSGKLGLPIGAPSSPFVSNATMYHFDERLAATARGVSRDAVLTRYADDIVFSSDERGACQRFHRDIVHALPQIPYPKLTLNPSKTIYSSRGTRRVVTGLVIASDGRVSLGRNKKRYIRKLLFDFARGCLEPAKQSYLSGYLAFILDVEPDFYNCLAIKYSGETVRNALRGEAK